MRPETGEYVWHYQTTPGETWDYTATQHIILADIEIDGQVRKVLMQAPKNGFFYVVDRESGELISAEPFVPTSWATHVDAETGRPVETEGARFYEQEGPSLLMPGPLGAHNWQPMSYSPATGLVYIPAQEMGFPYTAVSEFRSTPVTMNHGVDERPTVMPDDPAIKEQILSGVLGHLAAWDPVTQQEVWRVQHLGPNRCLARRQSCHDSGSVDPRDIRRVALPPQLPVGQLVTMLVDQRCPDRDPLTG